MQPNLTVYTSDDPKILTKRWYIDDEGVPRRESVAWMRSGVATAKLCATADQLARGLAKLRPNQAISWGVPIKASKVRIVPQSELDDNPDAIARVDSEFYFVEGPSWLMLDYDPQGEVFDKDRLVGILEEVCPGIASAPMVWSCSSSSYIYRGNEEIRGLSGQRLYIQVASGADIARAGKVIFDRLWLGGYGHIMVSTSGSMLVRSIVDASVWQPNRLDFVASPVCEDGLECRRPDPVAMNNDASPLDTRRVLPDLDTNERAKVTRLIADAKKAPDVVARAKKVRKDWAEAKARDVLGDRAPEVEVGKYVRKLEESVTNARLFGDYPLTHESGDVVRVADLLSDRERWHGARFYDPFEPSRDHRVARANLLSGTTPYIYTFMHGGMRIALHHASERLEVDAGRGPEIIEAILDRIRLERRIFERGGELVRVAGRSIVPVDKHWLTSYIESSFAVEKFNRRTETMEPADLPLRISEQLLSMRGAWGVPRLAGVIAYPPVRMDGTVAEAQGYDGATGLIYLDDREHIVPRALDKGELKEAIRRIWAPFREFPFNDALDRGVMLSAVLTAVARPTLPVAPAFLINAHTPSTGKTLLSRTLLVINGAPPSEMPLPQGNSEEISKILFAHLRAGTTAVTFDNLSGPFKDESMCATITSPRPVGRVLGRSEVVAVENRCMFILNGNNTSPAGDLYRRVLMINMDAGMADPAKREFSFHPVELIEQQIDAYRRDLLSIVLSYHAAGRPKIGKGELGSFEQWDRIVRQCVLWLRDQGVLPFMIDDPIASLDRARAEDPKVQRVRELFSAWRAWQVSGDERGMTARELKDIADDGSKKTKSEERFRDALRELGCPREGQEFSVRYFGYVLRENRGVIYDGLRLDIVHESTKGHRWSVLRVSGEDEHEDEFEPFVSDIPL